MIEPNEVAPSVETKELVATEERRYYAATLPSLGDKVVFHFSRADESMAKVTLPEYNSCQASILHSELTRKKNVSNTRNLCPQQGVAEVISVSSDPLYIFLSYKNVPVKDQELYMEYFQKSKRMLNFMKKLSYCTGRSLESMCQEISWPLYAAVADTEQHPLDLIDHPDKLADGSAGSGLTSESADEQQDEDAEDADTDADAADAAETTADTLTAAIISESSLNRIRQYHESFFGKLFSERKLRFGLLSYDIDGCALIRKSLMGLVSTIKNDFHDVEVNLNLRDIPVYELSLRSLNKSQLDEISELVTKYLAKQPGLLYKPMPVSRC
jgi:translation initiation factor 2 alpha subunit (eIF-2alpha)